MSSISVRPFLSLREATFRLGDRLIFPKSNWVFSRNEHWAVLGPNGSGKSLLADALRGMMPLVHGELDYHFRAPDGLAPEELIGHVGFEDRRAELRGAVAQSRWNSIEEDGALRVREFLTYERVCEINPFEIRNGDARARRQFDHRLSKAGRFFRISSFWDRTLISLSNGERQRVQLTRALCHPLRLLILDDPFVGLDALNRQHLRELIETLTTTSLRILLIASRLEDLPGGITHVLWVENCRIAAAGKRSEFSARSHSAIVARRPQRHRRRVTTARLRPADRLPLVVLQDVTIRYGASVILRNVNWTIYPGESWALLGPNGSGKTTLLSLILGDHPQVYSNHVEVFGRRRGTGESIWELKKRVGWVSSELQLHFDPSMTCAQAVASGFLETIGVFEPPTRLQRKVVRNWLTRFQILELADNPMFELSLGQQRMVLLARALVKNPELLILDEPCQALDASHRRLFLETLDRLLQSDTTTAIYVTHRPDEIPRSIKRVLRL